MAYVHVYIIIFAKEIYIKFIPFVSANTLVLFNLLWGDRLVSFAEGVQQGSFAVVLNQHSLPQRSEFQTQYLDDITL